MKHCRWKNIVRYDRLKLEFRNIENQCLEWKVFCQFPKLCCVFSLHNVIVRGVLRWIHKMCKIFCAYVHHMLWIDSSSSFSFTNSVKCIPVVQRHTSFVSFIFVSLVIWRVSDCQFVVLLGVSTTTRNLIRTYHKRKHVYHEYWRQMTDPCIDVFEILLRYGSRILASLWKAYLKSNEKNTSRSWIHHRWTVSSWWLSELLRTCMLIKRWSDVLVLIALQEIMA